MDANHLAQAAMQEGASMIIVSGGDGTVSAAATVLVGTCIPLGIISRGTANAFAKALGIPDNLELACLAILNGCNRTVDAAKCNGKPFVLLAGIGFEANTVEHTARSAKNRFGMLAYVLAGVRQLRHMELFETRIERENKVVTVNAAAVTIANAAPPTSILAQGPAGVIVDDGMLDITIVAPASVTGAFAVGFHLLKSALQRTAAERPEVDYLRARSVKVTTEPVQDVVLDGELIGTTPVEIECVPAGLTVLVPAV